jgi:hypothetical protein
LSEELFMKALLVAVIALVVLPADVRWAQTPVVSDNSSFFLRLPTKVDTTGLQIRYFMTGAFGGVGNFVRTTPGLHGYVIDTSYENKPAETLKIIVYCPGYGMALINVPSLAAASADGAYVELKPLPSVQLSGRIVAPEGSARKDFKIEVSYLADWDHEFFGIGDGISATVKLASADVRQDGSFLVAIPDFSRDPALDSFREKGAIRLMAREPKTGNVAYTLESAERPGTDAQFEIATKYNKLLLYATPYK